MTKSEALKLSIELWTWLAENPTKQKGAHPTLPVDTWSGNCALCEENAANYGCSLCVMYDHWPAEDGPTIVCLFGAFDQWVSLGLSNTPLDQYTKSFFAQVLVEAFQERLNQLENQE